MNSRFPANDHDTLVNHEGRISRTEEDVSGIKKDYVSKVEHAPTRSIAYGIASIFFTGIGVAIVGLIVSFFKK